MNNLTEKILKEFEYGKYLFGQNDDLTKIFDYPEIEKNTNQEEQIFKSIENFIYDASKTGIRNYLPELIKLKEKFPNILKPRKGQIVYRGLDIDEDDFEIILETKKRKKGYIASNLVNMGSFIYTSKVEQIPSSWSTDLKIARRFTTKSRFNKTIILKTEVNDKFIFTTDFTNYLSDYLLGDFEDEIICYAEKIKCDLIIYEEDYLKFYKNNKK